MSSAKLNSILWTLRLLELHHVNWQWYQTELQLSGLYFGILAHDY